jgi:hypothetical protein
MKKQMNIGGLVVAAQILGTPGRPLIRPCLALALRFQLVEDAA